LRCIIIYNYVIFITDLFPNTVDKNYCELDVINIYHTSYVYLIFVINHLLSARSTVVDQPLILIIFKFINNFQCFVNNSSCILLIILSEQYIFDLVWVISNCSSQVEDDWSTIIDHTTNNDTHFINLPNLSSSFFIQL